MKLGPKDHLRLGEWNCLCDRCGFKFKSSELRREWQGYMVCDVCFEPRHPQDLIKPRKERPAPPWTRNPADKYITDAAFQIADGTFTADGSIDADAAIGAPVAEKYVTFGPVDPDSL